MDIFLSDFPTIETFYGYELLRTHCFKGTDSGADSHDFAGLCVDILPWTFYQWISRCSCKTKRQFRYILELDLSCFLIHSEMIHL